MPSNERVRVAIVGAGIGGLTLSVALGAMKKEKSNLEISIYEASTCISNIGAGIDFWPRTWKIMKSIGLQEDLLRLLPQVPDGSSISEILAVLPVLTSTYAAFMSYEEREDEICLQFHNGQNVTCDVLIGMDGINSAVRKCFLTKQGLLDSLSFNPKCPGYTAYRGLIPVARLEAVFPECRALHGPMMYWGKCKHIVAYPISGGRSINTVFFTFDPSKKGETCEGPSVKSCTREEMLSMFYGWEREVQALIQCAENPTKWVIRALMPLESYSKGRVFLGGDAAHAMTPFQGGGAAQTIEDGYILAGLLSDEACGPETFSHISEVYNTICCPMGNSVLEKSKTTGEIYEFMVPGFEDVVEGDKNVPLLKLKELVHVLEREWGWIGETSPEEDKLCALELFNGGCYNS
ncbi:hypothetical protein CPB84DRAFT_1847209 [Gymnopilus junonius]|uniref:FAD-binding domain-containing protein n=1 Tax=Gymnopilus junonius TaxID=109634 RepID=A0A9P5NP13_GYMJU|nr:hypothetical protein CPB84DRAFT_1847209 [Gymnopilus junonius]